jgi:hypothetical protein
LVTDGGHLQAATDGHGNVDLEPDSATVRESISTDARSTPDALKSGQWSQESAERTQSPASDWQSDSSPREELQQALDRIKAAESKALILQEERNKQQDVIMQLMDDIGVLQSQLDELQAAKIERV